MILKFKFVIFSPMAENEGDESDKSSHFLTFILTGNEYHVLSMSLNTPFHITNVSTRIRNLLYWTL